MFLSFRNNHLFRVKNKSDVLKLVIEAGTWVTLKSVLRDYELTAKDKILLSYAIAWSYWHHYDSDLMRVQWTSERISFVHAEVSKEYKDDLPLRSYIDIPFEVSSQPGEDILPEHLGLNHRCPRIFDVGVLLLEIGLAKAFRPGRRRLPVPQANLNHKMAKDILIELENTQWEGTTIIKQHFDKVVGFCFDGENFTRTPKQTRSVGQGISARKTTFYKNVVCPLAWMAKSGFQAQSGDFTCVKRKLGSVAPTWTSDIQPQPGPQALFHGGNTIDPRSWLKNLNKIAAEVSLRRRTEGIKKRIRVTILDSGLNRDSPAFEGKKGCALLKSIADEKDFVVTYLDKASMTDSYGHGTFMARLVMECIAEDVEIVVARVARNTRELEGSQKNIKEVSQGIHPCSQTKLTSLAGRQSSGQDGMAGPILFRCLSASHVKMKGFAMPLTC